MVQFTSLLVALVPLIGVAWIVLTGALFTVDGLFMSLILLTISGICGTTALFEMRKSSLPASERARSVTASGGSIQRGKVRSVEFFESTVGQPNQSIVMLAQGSKAPFTLAIEGDLRNALPVGQKVEVTLRKQSGSNVLVDVIYG
jgi:hypothetical protein